jgi:photosystem II stability/assembly factor-like uncharacterized protein
MKNPFFCLTLVLFLSGVSFSQWSQTSSTGTTQTLRTVSVVSDNVVWVGANGGVVLRSTNGGTNWQSVGGGVIGTDVVFNIWGVDAQFALCTTSPTSGTFVYRTTNGGTLWTQVFSQTGGFINAIWMTSNSNGFMMGDPVGARWSLWRTTNGGVNWDSTGLYLAQVGTEAGWNNGMMILGSNIWVSTNAARIYYSSSNGTSWVTQAIPSAATGFGQVWFNSLSLGLANWNTTPVYTTNGGTNWTNGTVPAGTGNIAGIIGAGTTFWAVRNTATGVYKSTNNGVNWTTDYTAPSAVWHIGLSRTGIAAFAVGATGNVAKNPTLLTGITPIGGEVPRNYVLGQNYPNPFNPATTIKFSIPNASVVNIKVYDMLGNEVMEIVNRYMNAGNYSTTVDASGLASGVYFYTIKAGEFTDSKRMTLVK